MNFVRKGANVNKIITNSRGDQAVIRSLVIGFDIREAIPRSGVGSIDDHEPAVLVVRMASGHETFFEVAATDGELAPLVERFRKLVDEGGE